MIVQLKESHHFMKNFIRFSVNSKKVFLKNLIINQLNERNGQQKLQNNLSECQSDVNKDKEPLLSENENPDNQDESTNEHDFYSKEFIIDPQFIIECTILAILDLDG